MMVQCRKAGLIIEKLTIKVDYRESEALGDG